MSSKWKEKIMLHDYPECGPGELSIEDLYQMFKKRMAREASSPAPKCTWAGCKRAALPDDERCEEHG